MLYKDIYSPKVNALYNLEDYKDIQRKCKDNWKKQIFQDISLWGKLSDIYLDGASIALAILPRESMTADRQNIFASTPIIIRILMLDDNVRKDKFFNYAQLRGKSVRLCVNHEFVSLTKF